MSEPAASATGPRPRTILLLIGAVAWQGHPGRCAERPAGHPASRPGDLFRAALREGTPLGERAKTYMDSGELVPDDITIDMFMEELGKPQASRGAILDGFPRTVAQAEALDQTLAARGEKINTAMYIEVPSEELVSRAAGRSVCPVDGTVYDVSDPPAIAGICDRDGTPLVKRDDDRPEVVRERLAKQVPPMLDVVKHYEDAGVLRRINGQQPIDAVTRDIGEALVMSMPSRAAMVTIKRPEEVARMRHAGLILVDVLDALQSALAPASPLPSWTRSPTTSSRAPAPFPPSRATARIHLPGQHLRLDQ